MLTSRLFFAVCASFTLSCTLESPAAEGEPVAELTLLSFNIWRNGGTSFENTREAIRASNAEVVALQECHPAIAQSLALQLGFNSVDDGRGNAVLSRYPILGIAQNANAWGGHGVVIQLSETQRVYVFNAHLHYRNYGPYFLRDGQSEEFILEQEEQTRMPVLNELLAIMKEPIESGAPTFLVGDMNAPSHLDYANFAWPESLACYAAGLVDSYRELHPENRTFPPEFTFDAPGITWTPRIGEEPRKAFDRIDFIYYSRASGTVPTRSLELDSRNSVSPWPSDHRAVLTSFSLPTNL